MLEFEVGFLALLQEITGKRSLKKKEKVIEPEEKAEVKSVEPVVEENQKVEGGKRLFSDEETRRVYEESTKRVEERFFSDKESRQVYEENLERFEAQKKDYKPDKQNKSKKGFWETSEQNKDNQLVDEIKSMLQSPESAKKAIVLSEILNRRY